MLANGLWYLAGASFCLAVFALAYRLLLAHLPAFAWNRAYLLGALAAGALLPFAARPGLAALLPRAAGGPAGTLPFALHWPLGPLAATGATAPAETLGPDWAAWALLALAAAYGLGALRRLAAAARQLGALRRLARQHPRTARAGCTVVHLPAPGLPAFSFGRYVFLSPLHDALSPAERRQLLRHERVHVRQRHTLDLLLVEALGVVFWFHGVVPYLGRQLKAVHEYLADAAVAHAPAGPVPYGELLIKLAAQQPPFALGHAFAHTQIFRRIRMLTQPPATPMQKLRFLFVLPVAAFAWAATAWAAPAPSAPAPGAPVARAAAAAPGAPRIGRITWRGNAAVPTARLNEALGLRPGDAYDSLAVAKRVAYDPAGTDVSSLYMDHGYLYFQIAPVATRQADGTTDLAFNITEGRLARLRRVFVTGGLDAPAKAALLKQLPLRPGDEFSRAKLIETNRLLAQQSAFDPKKIGINPQPVARPAEATDLLDIELVLVPRARP
ncbi:MAG: POTRA domain-containing protein [Janthinobacterium lividum]